MRDLKVGDIVYIKPFTFIGKLNCCNSQLARIISIISACTCKVILVDKKLNEYVYIFLDKSRNYLIIDTSSLEYIGDFKKCPDNLDEILDI